MVPLNKGLQWVNVKQKPFRHNQTYRGIIQAYLEPCVTLTYLRLWYQRILTHSEPEAYLELWHIHNSGTSRTPLYSECWHIQNLRHIQNPVVHLR